MTRQPSRVGRIVDSLMNPVLDAVDMDAVLEHVDMNTLLARVDMNVLLDKVDIDGLIQRVDIDALIQRVDLDAVLQKVDIDGIVQRVDIGSLLDRVDVDGIIQRVDIDTLLERIDVQALISRANIGNVVTGTASSVAIGALDMVRQQLAGGDSIAARILHQPQSARPGDGRLDQQPAGGLTRLAAYVVDGLAIGVLFALSVSVGTYLANLVLQNDIEPVDEGRWWWAASAVAFSGFYMWILLTLAGRTFGKWLVGVRVQRGDGRRLGPGHALLRVFAYPFSFILGIGLIPILFGRRRRAMHDAIADTVVVHDWGQRPASVPPWLIPGGPAVAPSDASSPS